MLLQQRILIRIQKIFNRALKCYRHTHYMIIRLTLIAFLTTIVCSKRVHAQQDSALLSKITTIKLRDYQQQKQVTIDIASKPLTVLVFLSPECPLCKNYTKTLNELNTEFSGDIQLLGIIPGSTYSAEEIDGFINKYHITFPIQVDASNAVANYVNATVTPQAVLINTKARLLYTGAIDNWAQDLGRQRVEISEHYLFDAINQSLQSLPVKIAKTTPIGCKINDY